MIFKADRLPLTCAMLDYFYEIGGTCLDTAHVYRSERAVGQWLQLRGLRDEMVIIGKGARRRFGHARRIDGAAARNAGDDADRLSGHLPNAH